MKKISAKQAAKIVGKREAKRITSDGWINTLSGIGDPFQDKRLQSYYQRDAVNWDSAEDLWRSDDMAARVVECMPDEMTREGFELVVQDEVDNGEENESDADGDADAGPRDDAATSLSGPSPTSPGEIANKPDAAAGGRPGTTAQEPEYEPDEVEAVAGDDSKRIAELMMGRCDDLGALDKIHLCLCWARAYGGGALLIGADDGQTDWSKPLDESNIKTITFINALEPRELLPLYYYGNPRAPKYGEPMIYQLNRIMIAGEIPQDQAYLRIHESRLIRFDGIRVGRRQIIQNAGWGDSIFTRVIQTVQDFQNVWQGAALILSDFSQALLKIKGLAEMVAKNGKEKVIARAQAISASRSIANMVLIDAEEEFSRTPTPLSGFPEMMDRFCNRLAAAVKIPVTILMGQSPAGMNATGDSDLEWFSNQVAAEQKRKMKSPLERLMRLLFLDKSGPTRGVEPSNWSIKFPALKQLSEVDKADIRLKTSQADASDIQNDVLLPAEVAKSRYGGDCYSTETHVDLSLREMTRNAVQEQTGADIDDEFHTGRGEPGSGPDQPPPSAETLEAGDNVVGAGANKDPKLNQGQGKNGK